MDTKLKPTLNYELLSILPINLTTPLAYYSSSKSEKPRRHSSQQNHHKKFILETPFHSSLTKMHHRHLPEPLLPFPRLRGANHQNNALITRDHIRIGATTYATASPQPHPRSHRRRCHQFFLRPGVLLVHNSKP